MLVVNAALKKEDIISLLDKQEIAGVKLEFEKVRGMKIEFRTSGEGEGDLGAAVKRHIKKSEIMAGLLFVVSEE